MKSTGGHAVVDLVGDAKMVEQRKLCRGRKERRGAAVFSYTDVGIYTSHSGMPLEVGDRRCRWAAPVKLPGSRRSRRFAACETGSRDPEEMRGGVVALSVMGGLSSNRDRGESAAP